MDISIVVPSYNEEESLPELTSWIRKTMEANNFSYEVIIVDDGSSDASWKITENLSEKDEAVKGIKFRRNYGKSAALNVGFQAAKGDVVITMDADLQDSPEEIPELRRMILEDGFDMVSGWKKKRYDPITKTIPTKLYNWANRRMSGIHLHDFNCGLKAYRNVVIKNIEVYGEMHRYIPVIAKAAGYKKIGEKVVQHQARKYGTTKFGLERFINGPLDLMTISFMSKFGKRPMHIFGYFGMFMFFLGLGLFGWIGGEKIYFLICDVPAKNIAEKSAFFIALTAMLIGTQLFLAGFVAELIARNSQSRNVYEVENKVRIDSH